jgi:transketolase
MLLYSTLYLSGYGLSLDDLKNFRQLGSPTAGHPEYEYREAPGIEATTGPLGQGLAMSVGMALGRAMLAARFGDELIDHHTYVIASDGDIQEGVASEACSLAGHLGLGKLVVFFDNNHIQLAGPVDRDFSEDVASASRRTAGTCRTWARTSRSRRSSGPPRRRRAWRTGPRS